MKHLGDDGVIHSVVRFGASEPMANLFERRSMIVAAHPDDEVIGVGGHLSTLREVVAVIHVTDGAPRNASDARVAGFESSKEYAFARRSELIKALALVEIPEARCTSLEVADQEASLHLAELSRLLAEKFSKLKPEVIFTHPYEGGHPDHDATAFAVQAALKILESENGAHPALIEFTSYHAKDEGMETGEFLPFSGGDFHAYHKVLNQEERDLKRRMTDCFTTQQHMLKNFCIEVEKLRRAPPHNFLQGPHAGKLYYENFDWGMNGHRWRGLAREAARSLGINN